MDNYGLTVTLDYSDGFREGYLAGLMAQTVTDTFGPCHMDGCPKSPGETGPCDRDHCGREE